jgi:hypothetical protein
MSENGEDLLGIAQRFGPYSFVVNTDIISKATAEEQGWDLFNDPRACRQIRHPRIRRLERVQHVHGAGINPFTEHTDAEMAKYKEVTERVIKGARMIGDIAAMNQALIAGRSTCI